MRRSAALGEGAEGDWSGDFGALAAGAGAEVAVFEAVAVAFEAHQGNATLNYRSVLVRELTVEDAELYRRPGHLVPAAFGRSDEVVEVLEPPVLIVDGPLVQLALDSEYPLLRRTRRRPRPAAIQRRPPRVPQTGRKPTAPVRPVDGFPVLRGRS